MSPCCLPAISFLLGCLEVLSITGLRQYSGGGHERPSALGGRQGLLIVPSPSGRGLG